MLVPTIITVDRSGEGQLDLWRLRFNRYKLAGRYPIAVGAIGFTTPRGMYFVESKSRTPAWAPPEWAGHPEGTVFDYEDERNPFLAGFLSLAHSVEEGIGIHAVKFDPELNLRGRQSHGCIRMAEKDLLSIYDRVGRHTPVFIH